ncbi:hypothetical protein QP882_10570, partial [Corynebacterium marquesiae]|nr:hypothetical protein [Corynebacterium marquesiae]
MSTQRKALCAITLLVLALFLIVGAAIMSTHMALGVFLTTAARRILVVVETLLMFRLSLSVRPFSRLV